MKMFFLGVLATYLLVNLIIVIYLIVTEWRIFLEHKKDLPKIILFLFLFLFVGVIFAVANKDNL